MTHNAPSVAPCCVMDMSGHIGQTLPINQFTTSEILKTSYDIGITVLGKLILIIIGEIQRIMYSLKLLRNFSTKYRFMWKMIQR